MKPKKKITRRKLIVPKKCYFCTEIKDPYFGEVEHLRKFVTDRGKIIARSRNGLCAMHQRHLTISIKHARHLALMPFVGQR